MAHLAVIGGTGLGAVPGFELEREVVSETPYGAPSGALLYGSLDGQPLVFLARHGPAHSIAPHRVNYRANMWALQAAGCRDVLAVAAVGGIDPRLRPGALVVPRQIVDYTHGRHHTYYDDPADGLEHVDFTEPYDAGLRGRLLMAGERAGALPVDGGVYGATQGPRLESAAEINRMERDGCTLVGMTGMPEAALARELGLAYAHLAVVVNEAAGRGPGIISMEDIARHLKTGMTSVVALIRAWVTLYSS